MTAEIKVLTVLEKVAKNGNAYREIWVEIKIENQVFVRKLVAF